MLESKKVEEGEGLQEVEVERVPAVTEQNLPAVEGGITQQKVAEPKQQEREQLVVTKSNQRVTRSMLQKQLNAVAMVALDDVEGNIIFLEEELIWVFLKQFLQLKVFMDLKQKNGKKLLMRK
jgi:hypothetical protein